MLAGASGLARVDFFVEGDRVLLNELNTMPGFTATSVYAKLWEADGLAYPALVEELCEIALARHARERGYRALSARRALEGELGDLDALRGVRPGRARGS